MKRNRAKSAKFTHNLNVATTWHSKKLSRNNKEHSSKTNKNNKKLTKTTTKAIFKPNTMISSTKAKNHMKERGKQKNSKKITRTTTKRKIKRNPLTTRRVNIWANVDNKKYNEK